MTEGREVLLTTVYYQLKISSYYWRSTHCLC
nr:MAG TPA: hypothetical protein [Caudoviricetes sp.]